MDDVFVPYKNHDHIEKVAADFLHKYHPKDAYPTPIEEIVEFKLGIDIIPIPGLHEIIEIDGFISSDLSNISVDEYVYKHRQGRYRFTLAHEVGHAIMHEGVYRHRGFNTTGDWKDFMETFPENEWSWLEWQANQFAGLILVSSHHLEKRIKHHSKQIKALGIKNEAVAMDRIVELLARDFVVSREVILRRIDKEKKKI
ncbi:MAG: ImmA/IrrE family metallo-endopeptidase [Candidatus Omnitrophota bacterium]|nr:ImmA/IrrE family metallo-endopeptidase [Candidatus Omnitrophota bacterium]